MNESSAINDTADITSFADRLDTTGKVDDLIFVSVDDHIIEPRDLFEGRLEKKYQDDAPKVIDGPDGSQYWVYDGETVPSIGLNAVVGRPPEEWGLEPDSYSDMRTGCYDPTERVHDMDVAGVLASLCFPSFPQFCGQRFFRSRDKDLALAVVQAYNDWHLDAWAGSYPDRFIPCGITPLWNVELMAAEVGRIAAKGCHAVTFSENPYKLGLPGLSEQAWYPFWAACEENDVVVCMHLGSSSSFPVTSPGAAIETTQALAPTTLQQTATELVFSPFIRDFPNLKLALAEGGIGWIPYLLERVDWIYKRHHHWTGTDFGDKLPSDVFREHVISCFIEDKAGLALKDLIGTDMLCWEMDYPHADSTWPASPESFVSSMDQLDDEEIAAITHRNAMRLFHFDPFSHRRPEDCTVASLRASTHQGDLQYRSSERLRGRGTVAAKAEDLARHFASRSR
jgi:predicted TIM-barrel fold metal-dependent hydrolase